jgi:hypothetical protein
MAIVHNVATNDTTLLKSLAQSDQTIRISLDDILKIQQNNVKGIGAETSTITKLKATVYRFYKNLYVKDGALHTRASSGEEIGINNDVFEFYRKDLARLNTDIKNLEGYTDEQLQNDINDQLESILK